MLVYHSFIIKKKESHLNPTNENAKVDLHTVKRASDATLSHIKSVLDNVYPESSAKDVAKDVGTHLSTHMSKASEV